MTTFDEVINYSFYIFEQNFLEFEKAINSYTEELYSQDVNAFDLRYREIQSQRFEELKKQTARLLHNYLASWFSLREQTYAAENSLEKNNSLSNPSIISAIKSKKGEMFTNNPENSFIQELRNYIQHRSLPLIKTENSIKLKFGQPKFNINHSLFLDTKELLEWEKWNANAKKYLSEHSKQIPIKETIKGNFSYIQTFYQWLSKEITLHN